MHGISFSDANGNFRLTTLADKVKSTAETVVSKTADKEEIILKSSASMPNSPHPGRKPPVYEAGIDRLPWILKTAQILQVFPEDERGCLESGPKDP